MGWPVVARLIEFCATGRRRFGYLCVALKALSVAEARAHEHVVVSQDFGVDLVAQFGWEEEEGSGGRVGAMIGLVESTLQSLESVARTCEVSSPSPACTAGAHVCFGRGDATVGASAC